MPARAAALEGGRDPQQARVGASGVVEPEDAALEAFEPATGDHRHDRSDRERIGDDARGRRGRDRAGGCRRRHRGSNRASALEDQHQPRRRRGHQPRQGGTARHDEIAVAADDATDLESSIEHEALHHAGGLQRRDAAPAGGQVDEAGAQPAIGEPAQRAQRRAGRQAAQLERLGRQVLRASQVPREVVAEFGVAGREGGHHRPSVRAR